MSRRAPKPAHAVPTRRRDLAVPMRARRATTTVEFAVCALAIVLIVVGLTEFGRLVWTAEVLQETAAEGARCMGLRATSCASAGVYNATNAKNHIVTVAATRGVTITATAVTLDNAATCGGASGFSRVSISHNFLTVVPALLTSLGVGLTVPASACFPNNS